MIHTIDLHFQGFAQAIASFLVETSEGLVMIETGPHSTLPNLLSGIKLLGFEPREVRHVFLSHIHLDHGGAAWYFADMGAQVYVHPLGLPHLNNPERLMSSATRIYGDDMDRLWGEMRPIDWEQLNEVDHMQSITIGDSSFTAYHTPGHAVHHIAWGYQDVLFTGDVAGARILEGPAMPPCPPPDIDVEEWLASMQLIKELPLKTLYLTHYGAVSAIEQHLDELAQCLDSWASWIADRIEQGKQAPEVVEDFQQFVGQQLLEKGLNKQEIEVYEAANPSWMSVYGLYRYWKNQKE